MDSISDLSGFEDFPYLDLRESSNGGGGGTELVLLKSKSELSWYLWQRDWGKVVQLCENRPELLSVGMGSSNDTALHVSINDNRGDIAETLVDIIRTHKIEQALIAQNSKGETPLHCAAARGYVQMCQLILDASHDMDKDVDWLLSKTNRWHENPIFVAVVHNRKLAFICLCKAFPEGEVKYFFGGPDGDSILHSAIRREHLDLAFHVIQKFPELTHHFNMMAMSPLEILARTPSVFRSSYNLSWWKQIIYSCIKVDPLKYDPNPSCEARPDRRSSKSYCPENYLLCHHFLSSFERIVSRTWRRSNNSSNHEAKSQHPDHHLHGLKKEEGESAIIPNKHVMNKSFPQNYATCYEFLAFVYLNFLGMLGFGNIFTDIKKVKQKYMWSLQLLDALLEKSSNEEYMKHGNDLESAFPDEFDMLPPFARNQFGEVGKDNKVEEITNKALFAATENGVIEVVDKILRRFPGMIPEDTLGSSNKNILMVAVENQQAEIFVALRQHLNNVSRKQNLWSDLIHAVDKEDNTILHIAAKYDESLSHGWQAYGSAMQLQCEITWYEYVKSFLPSHFLFLKNSAGQTPVQIFTNGHKDLVEKGSTWLKDTSQSCSVVAALVAGVSFASRTVPGGTDNKGKPTLEGHPAFDLFAISGLMGLGFSVTALVMFLSILTSRKQPIDFKRNLPFKLLLGLSSLFVSIVSMFISFCASHFFVLEDKFKKGLFPLYAVTCLPISFYAIAQFPLYMDLLKAVIKHVPRSQKFVEL
ncbi:uncharacterized protein LOC129292384 [Prosopis cineraria]|uniref:uncharacterized protein LOC129292384 n=1 Tax=Prosopis cineraria TaxID=364024 RepID=UPI00240FD4F9|nr:uncharacterized protein LOC129292384 [Prosopis cineraria]